jgi:hypothetical protein
LSPGLQPRRVALLRRGGTAGTGGTVGAGGTVVDRNVYWLSTQPDQVNWAKTLGQPQAVMSQYADLQALQSLPRAGISVSAGSAPGPGPGGGMTTRVTVTDTPDRAAAFLLRADVRWGASGSTAGQPLPRLRRRPQNRTPRIT